MIASRSPWVPPRSYPVLVADLSRRPEPTGTRPEPTGPGPEPTETEPLALSALSAVTDAVSGSKPRPEPLDPPMVPFALAGLGAFTLAGLLGLMFRSWLDEHGHTDWLWVCVAGFLIGLVGLATMTRYDAHRRARRALSHPEVREIRKDGPPAD